MNDFVPSQVRTIFVGAGNYKQFEDYVRPRQAQDRIFIYADNAERICAHRGHKFETVGTFWDRPDALKIEELVKTRI